MALNYTGVTIGKIRIKQEDRHYTLQIRQGNALAILIHVRKATKEELGHDPKGKYIHTLYTFWLNEEHLKNIMKSGGDILFGEKVTSIELNMFYKENKVILKYLLKSGRRVTCYYKEIK